MQKAIIILFISCTYNAIFSMARLQQFFSRCCRINRTHFTYAEALPKWQCLFDTNTVNLDKPTELREIMQIRYNSACDLLRQYPSLIHVPSTSNHVPVDFINQLSDLDQTNKKYWDSMREYFTRLQSTHNGIR